MSKIKTRMLTVPCFEDLKPLQAYSASLKADQRELTVATATESLIIVFTLKTISEKNIVWILCSIQSKNKLYPIHSSAISSLFREKEISAVQNSTAFIYQLHGEELPALSVISANSSQLLTQSSHINHLLGKELLTLSHSTHLAWITFPVLVQSYFNGISTEDFFHVLYP